MNAKLTTQLLTILLFFKCPVLFAQTEKFPTPLLPEIISQFTNVRDFTISPDENEAYFTVQSPLGELSAIVFLRKQNGKWTTPEVAPFSGMHNDLEPFLSPDGLKLYFLSDRPKNEIASEEKDFDIWFVERKTRNDNWSRAINIGNIVNSKGNEFYPSLTISGNLYFTSDGPLSKGKDDILFCKWSAGKFDAPVSLSDSINSEGYEFNAFIAPDESYLIYTCYNKKGGLGSGDLYVSYNLGNGNWSLAKNMGAKINSAQMDYCPYVNEKSKTLFFTSRRSGIKANQTTGLSIEDFKQQFNRYDNGWSRLYQVPFSVTNR